MNINNNEVYVQRMALGMEDKLFYLNEIGDEITAVVDFGCANAAMGLALATYRPDLAYIGVDNNPEFLIQAQKNVPTGYFVGSIDEVQECLDAIGIFRADTALVLSSVLHEVFTYDKQPEQIMNSLLSFGFGYIVIRDMGLADYKTKELPVPLVGAWIAESDGRIDTFKNFADYYQYWLKYDYDENWDREYNENYFAVTVAAVEAFLSLGSYDICFKDTFVLQYIREKVKRDFGFDPFLHNTHYKVIGRLQR